MAKKLAYIAATISILIISTLLVACSNDKTYTVKYTTTDGGYIHYVTEYGLKDNVSVKAFKVSDGGDVTEVTAEPQKGYAFSGWSDGVTTATRRDKGVSKNITAQAIFVRSEYSLTYNAVTVDGYIDGESRQTVAPNADAEPVTAIANEGRVFTRWSDGVTTATRHDKNVNSDIAISALFQKIEYNLQYAASEHGSIQGEAEQVVKYNDDGDNVTAVPNKGYLFTGWSDGVTTAERKDSKVAEDISVTAEFKIITRTYKLNDRKTLASEVEENQETLTLAYGELDGVTLPVPQRDGFTFEGWYYDGEKIADRNGKLVIDDEFVLNEEKRNSHGHKIYIQAKWKAEETFPFKILIVYVTRIQATLYDRNGIYYNVDYRMTDLQRKFCAESTKLLKKTMDEMCDGLVDFQIDEYYTTQTITTEHLSQSDPSRGLMNTHLMPSAIPEVKDMLDDYDSVVSVFGFGGDNPTWEEVDRFQHASGEALRGECSVFLDERIYAVTLDDNTLEGTLKGKNQNAWLDGMEPFIHEIAHTIELRINCLDFHKANTFAFCLVDNDPTKAFDVFSQYRAYYLRLIEYDGDMEGIPYGFWKGEIANVFYDVTVDEMGTMGYVTIGDNEPSRYGGNHAIQEAVIGEDALGVKAVPSKGYRFVRWSDGVTTPERKDRNITEDFTVTAIFEPIVYTIKVVAGEGGSVYSRSKTSDEQGVITIEVIRSERTPYVYAVADEGYRFVGWSDGTTNESWSKFIQVTDLDMFDENNSYTLTAIFEKIE